MFPVSFASHENNVSAHGDRPWVFFMVDAFLLMTNFFIITFRFKTEEPILPQKMPPNGGIGRGPRTEFLSVHVCRSGETVKYQYLSREVSLGELSAILGPLANRGVAVRVSYGENTYWQDVIAVFNECKRKGIERCGLVPLRTPGAAQRL
jgi:biopolymer transport protein ExbD